MKPLLCLSVGCSDHNQTVDATYAANGNSSSEYTIVSVYERWENVSVHRYFFTIKKMGLPLFFIHQLPMVACIMSKKQKMQTLNQDMQILEQLKTRNSDWDPSFYFEDKSSCGQLFYSHSLLFNLLS